MPLANNIKKLPNLQEFNLNLWQNYLGINELNIKYLGIFLQKMSNLKGLELNLGNNNLD